MPLVITLLIFILLIIEGFGIQFSRNTTLFLIIFLFPLLFVHALFLKRKIAFPKITGILFLFFLSFTLASTALSINISQSVEYLMYFLSLFFVFLISYNFRDELEKSIIILVFASSILFSLYSLMLNFHLLSFFIPQEGYQFVFSSFGSHNHLGDFLALPIIICIYYLYNRQYILLSSIFCLSSIPLVVFSYSRSSYLTIALTVIFIQFFYLQKKHSWSSKLTSRITILIIILTTTFFFIATTRQAEKQSLPSSVNKYLTQNAGLKYKDILGERPEYIRQSFLSIQKHPIFGVGPNNFSSVSRLYSSTPMRFTSSAHNIFVEVLVGQGILGLLPFIGLILLILIKSHKNALYFVFLGMLINFQTDYTYQIYSFLLLFFMIAGILSRDKGSPVTP